jgi:chromosome segregation protein
VLASGVFLKSLEIRGFKSFADRTVLEFTPGVAVIVGPNGSGKSNLVDAIAWVLGEQGPKTLRGGRMEDVIFAGTPKRPASGRAEVALTIDNSSGLLPIDFTEVTVSRTIFRGAGDSEYAINGVPSRLLDVQELLSDTGVGRELHTIVGQGQLDEVLNARPEDRRAYIEEAAGILKHRRRKERAVRKLERTDADLERLGDVIAELRRQIRPLEQQAELAKKAADIEADMRAVSLRLWVHDYRGVTASAGLDAEERIAAQAAELAERARAIGERLEALEASVAAAALEAERALSSEYRLASILDRAAGLGRLAEERRGHLHDLVSRVPEGESPSPESIEEAREALEEVARERARVEAEVAQGEREWARVAGIREEAARAREEVVHLHGERAALRAAAEAAEDERRRLADGRAQLTARREVLRRELAGVREQLQALDERETALVGRMQEAESGSGAQVAEAERLGAAVRELERLVDALGERRSVLAAEAAGGSAQALLGAEQFPGLIGRLRDLVRARKGWERAVAAALDPLADAIVASSTGEAVAAVEHLKRVGGRAAFVVPSSGGGVPSGVRPVTDLIEEAPHAVRAYLADVGAADSFAEAVALARANPGLVVVTRDGDRVGAEALIGGSPDAVGRDPRTELAETEERLADGTRRLDEARGNADAAQAARRMSASEVEALAGRMNDLDAEITGCAERLATLEREEHAAEREESVMAGRISEVEERLAGDLERLAQVEARLGRSVAEEVAPVDGGALVEMERRAAERTRLLGALAERARASAERLADLERRAAEVTQARNDWERDRSTFAAGAERAGRVAAAASMMCRRVEAWVEEARGRRADRERERARLAAELVEARAERREVEARLEEAREVAHRVDLARAERSHRIAGLVERLGTDFGLTPDEALARAGAPPAEDEIEEDRRRAATLRRRLDLLGRVNPIAMEQHQGLVDRHAFLTEQVSDLKRSRRDLLAVVNEVDAKIVEIFSEAFGDVVAQFAEIFGRLFPGGEGRLTLTDPDNLLESGVEVEARPGGKRVKRISLLSGGERALTAIAMLCAIFRARPSPFYLLDEVEAALDDVNLHRFLDLAQGFKSSSQILVVTHQKRTMEIADVLYGISMGPDGVTRVISQRLEEPSPVS